MTETLRNITAVKVQLPSSLELLWSGGRKVRLDLSALFGKRAFESLSQRKVFETARAGDWGHSVVWADGTEIGADRLWLETLSSMERSDVREFLEWRMRHGLSLAKAAEALDMSRRMIAYYSSGDREVPRYVLLACRGWETLQSKPRSGNRTSRTRELAIAAH